MNGCHFRLLGSLKITLDGDNVTNHIPGGKAKLLLAYLILSSEAPQIRKRIAFDFWPDSTDKQALSNLRKLLHDLLGNVPQLGRYLTVTPMDIQWNPELPHGSDVREFERAAANGQTLDELRRAEALYGGDLLPGFYDEWLDEKRELLSQTYQNVLGKLIAAAESRRDYPSAILYTNKLLMRNKLREETYRTLMRLHALNGDVPSAERTYRQLRGMWQDELGIKPSEETSQWMERLRKEGAAFPVETRGRPPLIGRDGEWGRMLSAWNEASAGRPAMLVLRGEAGAGKTALAKEFKDWAERQGIRNAFAGCYPSVSSLSYVPVTAWLRSVPMPPLCPVALSELTRLMPELLEQFPDLEQPKPILESWQLNQWYEAIKRKLVPAGEPALLVLDDIQWSDGETLQVISYLLRSDFGARLLVVATWRPADEPNGDSNDDLSRFLSGLRTERKLTEIGLAPVARAVVR